MTTTEDLTPAPVAPVDSWLARALARRKAEDGGDVVVSGARFNSFI